MAIVEGRDGNGVIFHPTVFSVSFSKAFEIGSLEIIVVCLVIGRESWEQPD